MRSSLMDASRIPPRPRTASRASSDAPGFLSTSFGTHTSTRASLRASRVAYSAGDEAEPLVVGEQMVRGAQNGRVVASPNEEVRLRKEAAEAARMQRLKEVREQGNREARQQARWARERAEERERELSRSTLLERMNAELEESILATTAVPQNVTVNEAPLLLAEEREQEEARRVRRMERQLREFERHRQAAAAERRRRAAGPDARRAEAARRMEQVREANADAEREAARERARARALAARARRPQAARPSGRIAGPSVSVQRVPVDARAAAGAPAPRRARGAAVIDYTTTRFHAVQVRSPSDTE